MYCFFYSAAQRGFVSSSALPAGMLIKSHISLQQTFMKADCCLHGSMQRAVSVEPPLTLAFMASFDQLSAYHSLSAAKERIHRGIQTELIARKTPVRMAGTFITAVQLADCGRGDDRRISCQLGWCGGGAGRDGTGRAEAGGEGSDMSSEVDADLKAPGNGHLSSR